MKKEWSLSNDKALMNFSKKYCVNDDEVLDSEAFRSVLSHFLKKNRDEYSRINRLLTDEFENVDRADKISELTRIFKLLTIMDSEEIADCFPAYAHLYEERQEWRHLIEAIYKYWRGLERYGILLEDKGTEGLVNGSFIDTKEAFDKLILNLYRKVSNNMSMTKPTVYRQVPAGTNVGMILKEIVWPVPSDYSMLSRVEFIKTTVLETPFITYPKRNKRDGLFKEVKTNPLPRMGINEDHFFCYPAKVGDLLGFIYIHRDFLTHGISLSNLFELATEAEIAGRKPDLILLFGGDNHEDERETLFFDDVENQIMLGCISHHEAHDYFGYMKKMMLTLHNLVQIKRGHLPIHGAMVQIVLKDGNMANVVIVGDSGAGKSESIEAFRSLAEDHIADMTIIFDDMGTFKMQKDGLITGTGTEIGAFVRLDDLDAGYAFKELDRSIFMNPDKINARLINPVATYDEIMQALPVDICLYANNYEVLKDGENAVKRFDSAPDAIRVFRDGRRFAKGTTTEVGETTSYFANPFGPAQKQEETDQLLEEFFEALFVQETVVGELRTQLGVDGFEKKGPERAAIDLFDAIRELAEKTCPTLKPQDDCRN